MSLAPRPGRSYTTSNGTIVRVDYVRPTRVQVAAFGPEHDRETCPVYVWSPETFAELVEEHDFQPIRCQTPWGES